MESAVAVVAAAAAAAAEVTVAGGVCGGVGVRGGVAAEAAAAVVAEVVAGATAAVTNTSELTRFGLRNLNFLKLCFHYSLEIIFRNFNNSFLTSVISLQATFGI